MNVEKTYQLSPVLGGTTGAQPDQGLFCVTGSSERCLSQPPGWSTARHTQLGSKAGLHAFTHLYLSATGGLANTLFYKRLASLSLRSIVLAKMPTIVPIINHVGMSIRGARSWTPNITLPLQAVMSHATHSPAEVPLFSKLLP